MKGGTRGKGNVMRRPRKDNIMEKKSEEIGRRKGEGGQRTESEGKKRKGGDG
jgi:hypothetical protein